MTGDLYQILGVPSTADFAAIKRAYYRRAKECHPDRFQNSPVKTREFQILVEAFDTLSDGLKRRRYDISRLDEEEQLRTRQLRKQQPVMDSEADDILEELIVGNDAPPETSLATLLADLEKTEIFMKYREGRDHLDHRRNEAAEECFRFIVARAPQNIVFRVYLARAIAGATVTGRRYTTTNWRCSSARAAVPSSFCSASARKWTSSAAAFVRSGAASATVSSENRSNSSPIPPMK